LGRAEAARRAVGWVFAANGFGFASWASRLPAVRDAAQLTPAQLGMVLLALSAGAVAALPVSGAVVHRVGTRRTVAAGALLAGAGLAGAGAAPTIPVLLVALFCYGVASATWDVAMNVEGAAVERRLGRPLMPRFHAGFSLGTVAGAATGAAAAGADLPLRGHLLFVAALVVLIPGMATRSFLPGPPRDGVGERRKPSGALVAWRERRTLLIGLLVFGAAFCEGTANDWLAVAVVDGYHVEHAAGAAAFGVFVAAMTAGRLGGPAVLTRFGRVRVLVAGAGLVAAGAGLVVAGAAVGRGDGPGQVLAVILAVAGAMAWGVGASLGFPVGMSAAADEADRAAVRVGVVSSLGYTAFLAGPPLLGLLGERIGTLPAQLGVLVAATVMVLAAPAARPVTARPVLRVG
jgi:MFS family permease